MCCKAEVAYIMNQAFKGPINNKSSTILVPKIVCYKILVDEKSCKHTVINDHQ